MTAPIKSNNVIELRKGGEARDLPVKAFDGALTDALTPALTAANQRLEALKTEHEAEARGAKLIAAHIEPGAAVSITQVLNQISQAESDYSYRVLADKCKPLLFQAGVLKKINATKIRWATLEELQPDNKNTAADMQQQPKKLRRLIRRLHPQKLIDGYHLHRAKRDPYIEIKPDGTLQKHRRPFSGELTPAEKKARREAEERAAYAKLLGSNQPASKAAAELAEQKQLEAIERKAQQQAQWDTFLLWVKIIGLVAMVWFAVSSMGTGSATSDQHLPEGIQRGYSE